MSRRSRRSIELPLLRPFISASMLDPSALSPVAFSGIDMEYETIMVQNHSTGSISLGGYRICDLNQYHWFQFPADFVLPAASTVTVYCCPGQYVDRNPPRPYLLWTNKDGSLRSANVLNDDKETVYLYDDSGLCVSSCFRENGSKAVITRHSHMSNASRNFLSKCKLFLSYVRVLSLLYGGWCAFSDAGLFMAWFLFSHACDILGRCIWLGDSDITDKDLAIDPLLDSMNTTADRMSTMIILLNIIMAIPNNVDELVPSHFLMTPPVAFTWLMRLLFTKQHFVGLLLLDFASHWMRKNAEVYYASSLSSVTEASKTPLPHLLDDNGRRNSPLGGRSGSAHKRRSVRSKGKAALHDGSGAGGPMAEQDAVRLDPWPDTDELDLIDIMRAKLPFFLSMITVCNEIMLVITFWSVTALSEQRFGSVISTAYSSLPFNRLIVLILMVTMVLKEALLFTQFLTATSRVSFEVLSWNARRQVIPRMY